MLSRRDLILTTPALILAPSALLAQSGDWPQVELTYVYTTNPPGRRLVVTVATTRDRSRLRATVEEGGRRRNLAFRADLARLERVARGVRQGGGHITHGRTRASLSLIGDEIMRVRLGLPGGAEMTGAQPRIGPVGAALIIGGAGAAGFALGFTLVVAGGVVAIVAQAATQGGIQGGGSATATSNGGDSCECEVAPEGGG